MDAPEVMKAGLAEEYFVTSIPTLLAFRRGRAQLERKVVGEIELEDIAFLEGWVREEAVGGRGTFGR